MRQPCQISDPLPTPPPLGVCLWMMLEIISVMIESKTGVGVVVDIVVMLGCQVEKARDG